MSGIVGDQVMNDRLKVQEDVEQQLNVKNKPLMQLSTSRLEKTLAFCNDIKNYSLKIWNLFCDESLFCMVIHDSQMCIRHRRERRNPQYFVVVEP